MTISELGDGKQALELLQQAGLVCSDDHRRRDDGGPAAGPAP